MGGLGNGVPRSGARGKPGEAGGRLGRTPGQAGRVSPWPDLALLAPSLVWLDHHIGEAGCLAYSGTPRGSLRRGRLPVRQK